MPLFPMLPWWSAFPLSVGLGLLGVFAPDAVPEWLRIILFWTGAFLFVLGVVAALGHFKWGSRAPSRVNQKAYAEFSELAQGSIGRALGEDSPLTYEMTITTIEPMFLLLKKAGVPIPRLRRDGFKLGVLRAHRYLNLLHAPLLIGDNKEAKRRAMIAVPLINNEPEQRLWDDVEGLKYGPAPSLEAEEIRHQRRAWVTECRKIARAYDESKQVFRTISSQSCYIALKRHFSAEFVEEVERSGMTSYSRGRGAGIPHMSKRLLDELDRLSQEWGFE